MRWQPITPECVLVCVSHFTLSCAKLLPGTSMGHTAILEGCTYPWGTPPYWKGVHMSKHASQSIYEDICSRSRHLLKSLHEGTCKVEEI